MIALLLAFNVPSAKVNDIRVILEKSAITAVVEIPTTPQYIPQTPTATGSSGDTSYIPSTVNITNGFAPNPTFVATQLFIGSGSINDLTAYASTNQPIKSFSVVDYSNGKELYKLDALLRNHYATGVYQYYTAPLPTDIPDETKFTIIITSESGATATSGFYKVFYMSRSDCEQYAKTSGYTSLDCSITYVQVRPVSQY